MSRERIEHIEAEINNYLTIAEHGWLCDYQLRNLQELNLELRRLSRHENWTLLPKEDHRSDNVYI
jgi:hypothetical protein